MNKNQAVWDVHYTRQKSILEIPDENVVRSFQSFITRNQDSRNKLNILDLGCGTGRHINYFNRINFNMNTVAIDYSFNALDLIKNRIIKIQSLATDLPFVSECFDFILSWGVIHYLSQNLIDTYINEVYRVMKPQSTFLLTLRAREDSHLETVVKNGDLKKGESLYFSREEAISLFSMFSKIKYGYIMRMPLEEIKEIQADVEIVGKKVAHHIIEVTK